MILCPITIMINTTLNLLLIPTIALNNAVPFAIIYNAILRQQQSYAVSNDVLIRPLLPIIVCAVCKTFDVVFMSHHHPTPHFEDRNLRKIASCSFTIEEVGFNHYFYLSFQLLERNINRELKVDNRHLPSVYRNNIH